MFTRSRIASLTFAFAAGTLLGLRTSPDKQIYQEVMEAGKDLLAEKPFGIDLSAAEEIADTAESTKRFVRCSSEFPFETDGARCDQYLVSRDPGHGGWSPFQYWGTENVLGVRTGAGAVLETNRPRICNALQDDYWNYFRSGVP